MQLFSSKVEEVSVAISWATISTAWLSRWCFLTKASLAKTAAPAPSEVGLRRERDDASSGRRISQWRQMTGVYGSHQHCSRVRYSNTFLELITCSKLYSSWNWEYLHERKGNLVQPTINRFEDSWQECSLTGYWWNVCGFSRRFWQSVLV